MPRSIPEERFQELIDAATAAFLEQGYRRTQVADVAARLGVAKGSVYTYVESKEALFHAVVRQADRAEPLAVPDTLPVPTPPPGATLEEVRKRVAQYRLPELGAALTRRRAPHVGPELEAIVRELYGTLSRHRTGIKLLDRCALDYPDLAKLWYRAGREGALALLSRYLDDRARRGRVRRFEDPVVAVRLVLETLVFWAVHRHWDPSPHVYDAASSRRTVLEFLIRALVKE